MATTNPPNKEILIDLIKSKVKAMQDLTPEEEVIYLVHIEDIPLEEAKRMVYNKFEDSEND